MKKQLYLKKWNWCLIFIVSFLLSSKAFSAERNNLNFLQDSVQNGNISFVVIDENESTIPNVTLNNSRTNQSSVSDSSGIAKLMALPNDVIHVSINGTIIQDYTLASSKRSVIVVSSKNLLVSKRKQVFLTNNISVAPNLTAASTSAVYNNDLIKNPVTSVRNALTGRLAGVYTNQTSGRPGADEVNLLLRGQNPLLIIDGVPRNNTNLGMLDLEEIESVTVLKDALSAAMLGIRASNGAIVITTKKGSIGAQRISFTAQGGLQSSIKPVKVLDSYNYAKLYNEALTNSGGLPVYSATDLAAYQSGSDPIGHPNVNWQDQVFDKSSVFSRYDLNVKGGDKTAKYYVGLEYQNQQGDLKQSSLNTYSTNNNYNSYLIRSNIDVNLSPKTLLSLHLLGRIVNNVAPGVNTDPIYTSILNTPNLAYPLFNLNGTYGGNTNFQNNIYAQSIGSGYNLNYKRDIITDISLRRNFDGITKGLWAQALISSYSFLSENTNRSKTFAVFQQNVTNGVTSYQQFGTNGTQINTTSISYQNRQSYLEGAIGYTRRFGYHGIDAQVRATSDNTISNSDLALQYYGGSGRVAYDFDKRYVAEFSFGVTRTNRYPPGTPFGFFPAAGLTWDIAKEKFFHQNDLLNGLKIFATYGKTGNDVAGYYNYNQYYNGGSNYYFSTGPTTYGGLALGTLANTGITWEKANKLNLGLKADLLKNKLFLQVEYYNNKYYNLLSNPNLSSIVGINVQNLNIGINRYSGEEVQLNWQQSLGKFSYYITGNASLLKTKVLYQNEVYRQYSYLQRTGRPVGQTYGYMADGLFQSQDEINKSSKIAGYNPVPGDIKYKDLNNDGAIDQFDQTTLGTTKPLIYYGSTVGFSFKGFDFSALVQGVANRNMLLIGSSVWEFQNNGFGQAYEQNLNRWTPATAATATYPRVSIGTNVNNDIVSSYWMHSGDYIRLKNIEVGYSLPFGFVNRIKLSSLRIFVNGTNLLTHSAYSVVDPETNSGAYPIQRVVNGGVNIKF